MKRITATLLFVTAFSAPAFAETPVDRQMHSWDYVQQVATPQVTQEAPPMEHHEQHNYYHHDTMMHKGKMKHHGKMMKHKGKMHHKGKHHHHHHHMDKKMTDTPAKDQMKQ